MKGDSRQRESAEARVAFINGAGGDLGRAGARRLAREGVAVVLCDTRERVLNDVAAEIRDAGGQALTVTADATRDADVRAAVGEAAKWHERIDVLVNCMSVEDYCPWDETSLDEWERHLKENLTSVFLSCREVTPHMKARRSGKIVNVASSAGRYRSSYFRYDATFQAGVPYASSHGGVLALTRELAFELAGAGICVNAVVPGLILTERMKHEWSRLPEQVQKDILTETALGRLGKPEEVAAVISFLSSAASSSVTATAIDVNGGWWMS